MWVNFINQVNIVSVRVPLSVVWIEFAFLVTFSLYLAPVLSWPHNLNAEVEDL